MSVLKKEISQSTDMKWHVSHLILWDILLICTVLLPVPLLLFSKSLPLFFIIVHPLLFIWCFWSVAYHAFQIVSLYRFAKKATVANSCLDDPHVSWGHRVYFCITVETEDGQLLAFESKAIYGHTFRNPRYDDYNGKQVKVAYSAEENRIVVLSVTDS